MRFIPTRVGYTEQHSILRHRNRFIPTRVGYTSGTVSKQRVCHGSSPLAWGIPLVKPPLGGHVRFIPTRVGYTDRIRKLDRSSTVHPHSRGVYMGYCMDILPYRGSSPLAWGIRQIRWVDCDTKHGSSPLAWGIRNPEESNRTAGTVHPHSRGVYISISFMKFFFFGSSPLAWGIHFYCFLLHYVGQGSSPLAWGIPKTATESALTNAVHPHSRGVYFSPGHFLASVCRFIPTRVGYTLNAEGNEYVAQRFIPTRVGYTESWNWKKYKTAGSSPLAWGIRITIRWFCRLFSGSSPLAWGILVHPCVQHIIHRFIPTRVGYTCPGRIPWL